MRKLLIAIIVCITPILSYAEGKVPIDQVPMYGGLDRKAIPDLQAGDESLIEGTTREFGSREKASMAFVNRGFTLYQQDDLAGAMRRFNQAWLINPENAEAYWGFASVLHDRQEFCEARRMIELAFSKGGIQPGFLPDAAVIYTGCAITSKLESAQKNAYLKRSEELFEQALAANVRPGYIYYQWARAMYGRGDYAAAWEKVAKFRAATGTEFDANFLRVLRGKMPELGN